ncbi:MAG: hypothetical protein WB630_08415 [Candidatus Acidiferrales bacterium]
MPRSLNEAEISSIVASGGGKYVGILKEIPERMESIVLFISLQTKTKLGVPLSRLTAEAVREQLVESNAAFKKNRSEMTCNQISVRSRATSREGVLYP